MNVFLNWLATSPLASALKVGLGFLLTAAVMAWTTTGTIDFAAWQTWVIGALGVSVPIVVNALNPDDSRYGRAKDPGPDDSR
jgi:hypothetical protein